MSDTPAVTGPDLASLDQALGADGTEIVLALAERLRTAGRVSDVEVLVDAVLAREALGSTVLPGGIAMPHARSAAVVTPSIAVARLPEPVSFTDGAAPVSLVLLLAAAGDQPDDYLALLQKVATALVKPSYVADLMAATSPTELADLVLAAVSGR